MMMACGALGAGLALTAPPAETVTECTCHFDGWKRVGGRGDEALVQEAKTECTGHCDGKKDGDGDEVSTEEVKTTTECTGHFDGWKRLGEGGDEALMKEAKTECTGHCDGKKMAEMEMSWIQKRRKQQQSALFIDELKERMKRWTTKKQKHPQTAFN